VAAERSAERCSSTVARGSINADPSLAALVRDDKQSGLGVLPERRERSTPAGAKAQAPERSAQVHANRVDAFVCAASIEGLRYNALTPDGGDP